MDKVYTIILFMAFILILSLSAYSYYITNDRDTIKENFDRAVSEYEGLLKKKPFEAVNKVNKERVDEDRNKIDSDTNVFTGTDWL